MAERLRIFLSSPGDVGPERSRAALIIAQLAKDYARFFHIESYLWESEPMLASGHFQDIIEPPSQSDIVLLILWSRLGTSLPERTEKREYKGIDGRVPVTGTEWEFENALTASHEKGAPDLLVYRKSEDPVVSLKNVAEKIAREAQWAALEAFWARYFADRGQFKTAYSWFENLDAFENRLKADLTKLIERRIAARVTPPMEGAIWLKGNPFRGLQAYDFDHAPVFFGRSEATQRSVERLAANGLVGRSFLLILGASGSGKSSLAFAGIMPALFAPGVVPAVGLWRRASLRPGSDVDGPFAALAQGLAAPDALPELLAPGQTPTDLSRHFTASTSDPSYLIVAALARLEDEARKAQKILPHESTRLILVADQLEELYTSAQLTQDQRRAFIACLDGLARSSRVTVVATMRSDHWHRASETPLLVDMAGDNGRLDLLPPTQAEIDEMIRRPAQAAGVAFETDSRTEIALNATLAEEAAAEPGALPLLSYLLEALYSADVGRAHRSVLTYATAKALDGLKGAIANRADAVLAAQPKEVANTLPALFRLLVQSRLGENPTARTALLANVPGGTPLRGLIDAFLAPEARLLVADGDDKGARIRIGHEALLVRWKSAVDWLRQNRRDLETRARLEETAALWAGAGTARVKRQRLLTGLSLAEGRDLTKRWADGLSDTIRDFVRRSDIAARVAGRRAWGLAGGVIATLVVLVAAMFLFVQVAETVRNQALIAQSKFLARDAQEATDSGFPELGVMLALEALPRNLGAPSRPLTSEAWNALSHSTSNFRESYVLGKGISSPAFSPDGTHIVASAGSKGARVWETATGSEIAVLDYDGRILSAAFNPDGTRIVTGCDDGTARIWDAATGKSIAILRGHLKQVTLAQFSPDGTRILTEASDETARVWNPANGDAIVLKGLNSTGTSAIFSPDGSRILARSKEGAHLWDAATGNEIAVFGNDIISAAFGYDGSGQVLRIVTGSSDGSARIWSSTGQPTIEVLPNGEEVNFSAFSPDGTRIVTISRDRTAQLWYPATGERIGPPLVEVLKAAFSPDSRQIVTVSADTNDIRVWDARSFLGFTNELATLKKHELLVNSVVFTPDGTRLFTVSEDIARMWDVPGSVIARPAAVLKGHSGDITSIEFSPDGRLIVTGSIDQTARIWDAATGNQIGVLSGHGGVISSAAFSPDGMQIVTSSDDKTARVWNVATGKNVLLRGHNDKLVSATFSPDGTRIVTASNDKTGRVWDAATGNEIAVLHHEDVVHSAIFSRDGARIVTATTSTTHVWDAVTGTPMASHPLSELFKAFNSDGTRILTWSGSKAAVLDAMTGDQIAAVQADGREQAIGRGSRFGLFVALGPGGNVPPNVLFAALSPDATRIITASDDKTVQLWDAVRRQPITTLPGIDSVGHVAFSADGTRMATVSGMSMASNDRTARVWLTPRCQNLIDAARNSLATAGYGLTPAQRANYFLDVPESSDRMLAIYSSIRPWISWALPQAGETCR